MKEAVGKAIRYAYVCCYLVKLLDSFLDFCHHVINMPTTIP